METCTRAIAAVFWLLNGVTRIYQFIRKLCNVYDNLHCGKGFKEMVAIARYEGTLFVSDSSSVTSNSPNYQFPQSSINIWPRILVPRLLWSLTELYILYVHSKRHIFIWTLSLADVNTLVENHFVLNSELVIKYATRIQVSISKNKSTLWRLSMHVELGTYSYTTSREFNTSFIKLKLVTKSARQSGSVLFAICEHK